MSSSLRIIVTGLIAQHPGVGGITWHYLQYVLGLASLGHDVYYLEDSGEVPYNLNGGTSESDWFAKDCTDQVGYLATVMSRFGLDGRWAYRYPTNSQWFGLSADERRAVIRSADLLINVSGTLEHPGRYRRIPRLIYIDTDPLVTQIKIATRKACFSERVDTHDIHFSFGECLTDEAPATGHRWRPTRQPIVLSEWQPFTPCRDCFTTIMNWTSYEPLRYAGKEYGQKDVEFKRLLELPRQVTPAKMEVALNEIRHLKWEEKAENLPPRFNAWARKQNNWTPRDLITWAGWRAVDPSSTCSDLDTYRHYIQSSKAEWSVAKNAYVQGQCGWFSERSACYLAAGRPVVVQDTGFSKWLPIGDGVLPFNTLEEAVAAIREVESDYARHAKAARSIAEEYFDSDKVLTRLIDEAMSSSGCTVEGVRRSAPDP